MPELDILVIGDANPDLVLRGSDLQPAFGQAEKLIEEATLAIGGSGAIFACGAARLGLKVGFSGLVGDDALGRFMRDSLEERGVDASGLVVEPSIPTGVTIVLSTPGDRAMLTAPGTIAAMTAERVDRSLLRSAGHVHVSSYFLQAGLRPGLAELFREARSGGASTSVDPNWDPAEDWDGGLLGLLPEVNVFLPNSAEARLIAGVEDIDVACAGLAAKGPVVAVKFGQGGGLVFVGEDVIREEAVPIEVVDTTGAGDGFDAGFLAGWLQGWGVERSLKLAVACGSLSTRAAGGTQAQPTMDEALAFAGVQAP